MKKKLYAERDLIELDKAGNFYCKHVSAMTAEQLHSKSDIAAELAHRDMQIDMLQGELDHMRVRNMEIDSVSSAKIKALQAKIDQLMFEYCPDEMTREQIAEFEKHQEPLGEEFEKVLNENLWELYEDEKKQIKG